MEKLITNRIKWIGLLFLLGSNIPAYAYTTVDEQIDHYLKIMATGSYVHKTEMLKQLQWSGLSTPRFYDEVEKQLLDQYLSADLDKRTLVVLAHQVRALAYSGNEKYRNTMAQVNKEAVARNLRKHARKALSLLDKYVAWNKLIAASDFTIEGKSVQVATYMKMLSVDDVFVQRLAARATFHERLRDPDLLALAAKKLKALYMQDGLDREAQDTAAWLSKAIGQSGVPEYGALLSEVANNSPYKKISKYAIKYAF